MRLSALVPSIPADFVASLNECGIRTDADLLFSPVLEIYRRLPSGSPGLYELEQLVARVADLASAPGISAADMLAQETETQTKSASLYTGVSELDALLDGFGGRRILEISGDTKSGKTALALHVVLRELAEDSNSNVVWMDTTGDFSIDRAIQFLESYTAKAASTALERLQVSLAFDIEAAYDVLGDLQSAVSTSSGESRLCCIVIDAITPLLGPLLSAVSAQGHSIMTGFMRQLRMFSQSYSCAIIVINSSTLLNPRNPYSTNISQARKPALGPSFTFLTDATLWVSKVEEEGAEGFTVHTAKVLRSKSTPSQTWCTFKISQARII